MKWLVEATYQYYVIINVERPWPKMPSYFGNEVQQEFHVGYYT